VGSARPCFGGRGAAPRTTRRRSGAGCVTALERRDDQSVGLAPCLEREQDGRAPPIGPFQQRDVELAEALAQAFLEPLLAGRDDAHPIIDLRGLVGGEEGMHACLAVGQRIQAPGARQR